MVLGFWFLVIAPAQAATFYVAPVTGSGVSASDLSTATQLVESAVPQSGDHQVVDGVESADYSLQGRLLKLGTSYLFVMDKTKGSKRIFTEQMKAKNIEELDQVALRLTRAVILGSTPQGDIRVGEVTHQEAEAGKERRPARKGNFLGFGPALFSNLNSSSNAQFYLTTGEYWDVNDFMVKLSADLASNLDAFYGTASLGGHYFLTNQDTAPYVAADFGGGYAKSASGSFTSGESAFGFEVGGGAGIQFLRTSTINLEIGLRASVLLRSLSTGTPSLFALRLGFYF